MTQLRASGGVMLTVAMAAGVLTLVLPLQPSERAAAQAGVVVELVMGLVALGLKHRFSARHGEGEQVPLKVLMLAQGLTFGLRLVAVLVGTFACLKFDLSPIAFVVGFFSTYLVHQGIEVRHLLGATAQPKVKA